MATVFYNMATLSYSGGEVNSNVVTGRLEEVLTLTKTAVSAGYAAGGTVSYAVSISNSGTESFTGLTLEDDLGGYAFGTGTVYPLAYEAGSLRYYLDGVLQPAPAVTAGPPMTVSGLTVPAGGSAMVLYEARVTRYAPLASESTVVNTASVTGGGLTAPVTDTAEVGALGRPDLCISKSLSPTVVAENGRLTYTFVIQNSGNTAVTAADDLVLRDTFNPVLRDITVTFNGTAWTEGTEYTYSPADGKFATVAGRLTVPAGTFTQDPVTGAWSGEPGVSTLVISGTV